jgi:hypothetical protein
MKNRFIECVDVYGNPKIFQQKDIGLLTKYSNHQNWTLHLKCDYEFQVTEIVALDLRTRLFGDEDAI